MTIENLLPHNSNGLYDDICESISKQTPFKKLYFYYSVYHRDNHKPGHKAKFYALIDYVLDQYEGYRETGFTNKESKINSLLDGLDLLIEEQNERTNKGY